MYQRDIPLTCKDCDWVDVVAGLMVCTVDFDQWKVVEPDHQACREFVRTDE